MAYENKKCHRRRYFKMILQFLEILFMEIQYKQKRAYEGKKFCVFSKQFFDVNTIKSAFPGVYKCFQKRNLEKIFLLYHFDLDRYSWRFKKLFSSPHPRA